MSISWPPTNLSLNNAELANTRELCAVANRELRPLTDPSDHRFALARLAELAVGATEIRRDVRATSCQQGCASRRGVVLLVVAVVVLLMGVAAYSFLLSMRTEHAAVRMDGGRMLAQQAAYSARDLLLGVLDLPRARREELGGLIGNDLLWGPKPLVAEGAQYLGRTDVPRAWVTLPGQPQVWGALDESTKVHLGQLMAWDQEQPGIARQFLLQLPAMDEMTADSLLDWLDADDQPRFQGAERDFYLLASPQQPPRNGLPLNLDQLLWVRGVTADRLWGLEALDQVGAAMPSGLGGATGSANSVNGSARGLDAAGDAWGRGSSSSASGSSSGFPGGSGTTAGSNAEPSSGSLSGDVPVRPWADYLTIYSAERNTAHDGRRRVNVNQDDLSQLYQQLSEVFPAEWANYIVAYRQASEAGPANDGSSDDSEAGETETIDASAITLDLQLPATRRIDSLLDLVAGGITLGGGESDPSDGEGDDPSGEPSARGRDSGGSGGRGGNGGSGGRGGRRGGGREQQRNYVPSPLAAEGASNRESLIKLLDLATISGDERIVGRVNVLTCPREVLTALPGLDEALIERIVSARSSLDETYQQTREPVWLLTEGLVDLPRFKQLLPKVTQGGDVFQAECWGYVQPRLPRVRCRVVVDGARQPARQIEYRELPVLRNSL